MNQFIDNKFLDVRRIQFIKYLENEIIPLYISNIPTLTNKVERILTEEIPLKEYTIYGLATHETFIKNYFELFVFKYDEDYFSVGILEEISNQTYSVYYDETKEKKGTETTNLSNITVDMFMYRKNPNPSKGKFWETFHYKDESFVEVTFHPKFLSLLQTVNFNHLVSTILDFFNLAEISNITAENIGIERTKDKFKQAVIAKEDQINILYELLGKNLNKLDLVKMPTLRFLDSSAKEQIQTLFYEHNKTVKK